MPKLAEAWVDLTTKDVNLLRLANARKETDRTGKVLITCELSASNVHRLGSAVRRTTAT